MINITTFCPFKDPEHQALCLRFDYDYSTVECLKVALRSANKIGANDPTKIRPAGGWLPSHRCWFVQPWAWPIVQHWLDRYLFPYTLTDSSIPTGVGSQTEGRVVGV